MTLTRCKRCGRYPEVDRVKNEVRCPGGCFRFSAPAGKDACEVWESVQESIRDERNWGQPRQLSRKERQERFDARREAEFRRKALRDMMEEERAVYD